MGAPWVAGKCTGKHTRVMSQSTSQFQDLGKRFHRGLLAETKGAAMGSPKELAGYGIFIGQTNEFMQLLNDLATDADQAESNDK